MFCIQNNQVNYGVPSRQNMLCCAAAGTANQRDAVRLQSPQCHHHIAAPNRLRSPAVADRCRFKRNRNSRDPGAAVALPAGRSVRDGDREPAGPRGGVSVDGSQVDCLHFRWECCQPRTARRLIAAQIRRVQVYHHVRRFATVHRAIYVLVLVWLAVFNWRTFLDLWLTWDHFVGRVSAMDQPTRPTQPSIPLGSVNML